MYVPRTCFAASMFAGESVLGVSELNKLITERSYTLGTAYVQSTPPCELAASARWHLHTRTHPGQARASVRTNMRTKIEMHKVPSS